MTPEQQKAHDQAEIKVKLIDNGVLVKIGPGWFAFDSWVRASECIGRRIETLLHERRGS